MAWMTVDPNAGNTLLTLTSGSKMNVAFANQSPFIGPAR